MQEKVFQIHTTKTEVLCIHPCSYTYHMCWEVERERVESTIFIVRLQSNLSIPMKQHNYKNKICQILIGLWNDDNIILLMI